MHGRPDVIEELNLKHRLKSASSHSDRATNDVRLRQRRVKDAGAAKLSLEISCHLEYAALTLHFFEILLTRAIGDVFAENDDARVSSHLGVQATINQIDHRARIAGKVGALFIIKISRSRIHVRRVDKLKRGFRSRLGAGKGAV